MVKVMGWAIGLVTDDEFGEKAGPNMPCNPTNIAGELGGAGPPAGVMVIVAEPEPMTGFGFMVTVAPLGCGSTLSCTAPENPFTAEMVAV
jgi:hypothetical protein